MEDEGQDEWPGRFLHAHIDASKLVRFPPHGKGVIFHVSEFMLIILAYQLEICNIFIDKRINVHLSLVFCTIIYLVVVLVDK